MLLTILLLKPLLNAVPQTEDYNFS
jgi:hypothetical protein